MFEISWKYYKATTKGMRQYRSILEKKQAAGVICEVGREDRREGKFK